MNQCVPLAHYLACFAKQRTSGLQQRIERCLGFRPFLMLSSSEGTPHRQWTDGVDDDPAAGRVYGDSGCSGHRTNPPSPAHSCLSRTEIGSFLQADRQRDANFTVYLQTNSILRSDKWLYVPSDRSPWLIHHCVDWKEADLVVITAQS